MKTVPDITLLQQIVVNAAREELAPRFTQVIRHDKADGSFITAADLAMQQRIQTALQQRWPDYAFLGEEMAETEQLALLQNSSQPLWCLDPLDGTSNFAAHIPFFSVSLALIVKGEVVLGIIYDPMRDECFSAIKGQGASLNGQPLGQLQSHSSLAKATALVDLKRLPSALQTRLIQQPPYSSQRSFGSVALDWCWIAAGRCHVYLHGKQRLWDYAAGQLILSESGGQSCTLAGEPVLQASLAGRSAVAALDGQLFRDWTNWLGIKTPDLE